MSNFSIGEAWSQAVAFLQNHLQMLVILVGGGLLIAALLEYLGGGGQAAQMDALTQAIKTGDWKQLATANQSAAGAGAAVFAIASGLIQMAVQFAALRMGLGEEREEIGSALSYGLGAALLTLLFYIAAFLGLALVIIVPIAVIVAATGAGGGTPSGGMIALFFLIGIVIVVAAIWLSARLAVVQPAMASVRSMNPIHGIKESWRLTDGHALPIIGYTILIGIVMLVAFAILGGITGFIGSLGGPLVLAILMAVLVSAPAAIVGVAINAGLYKALAPDNRYDIFA